MREGQAGEVTPSNRREAYLRRYAGFKKQGKPFWPDIILEDVLVALVVFLLLVVLVVAKGTPLEARADPTNTAYIPRPEWYFMFLFQLLKLFPGYLEWVGVIAVPAIGVLLLILLPFVDLSHRRLPRLRPVAMAAGAVTLLTVITLSVFAFLTTPSPQVVVAGPGGEPVRLTASQLAGRQLFRANCTVCHSLGEEGKGQGLLPLDGVANRMDPVFIHIYIENPQAINPQSAMPPFLKYPEIRTLTHEQVEQIVEYLKLFK